MDPLNPQPNTLPEPKKNWFLEHKFAYSILGVILLAIIAGSVFLWKDSRESVMCIAVVTTAKNPETGEVKTFGSPCEVPDGWMEVPEQIDPTADWKTYTNEEYGFEFKYPGDWKTGDCDKKESIIFNPKQITCGENFNNPFFITILPLDNYDVTLNFHKKLGDKIEQKVINNIDLLKISWVIDNTSEVAYLIKYNDRTISIRGAESFGVNFKTIDQILSTFKFTDSTADWKTYTNEKFGFEIKIPQDWTVNNNGTAVYEAIDFASPQTLKWHQESINCDVACEGALAYDIYFSAFSGGKDKDLGLEKIGSITWNKYLQYSDGSYLTYEVTKDDKVYRFGAEDGGLDEKDEFLNQILSTFKFTK